MTSYENYCRRVLKLPAIKVEEQDRCEADHKDGGVCLRVLQSDGCPGAEDHMQFKDNKGPSLAARNTKMLERHPELKGWERV